MLSRQSFANALRQRTADPYLAAQLVPKGTLLSGYSLLARSQLANDISLLSGQSPNADTEQNCPTFTAVQPPMPDTAGGPAGGGGCVYPRATQTLADELTTGGLTWKAYLEGMDEAAPGATCRHPALGAVDPAQAPGRAPGQAYLGYRNPFVYFDSLLEGGACASDDVDLGALAGDLVAPTGPPNLSWIVPSACHDGSPTPCSQGAPAGLAGADVFLSQTVPAILRSSAYRDGGLLLITFDAAPSGRSTFDAGPSPAAGSKPVAKSMTAAGSRPIGTSKPVGALLISPFVRAHSRVQGAYNQLSLLASLERLFGIPLLGHAADANVKQLGGDVYLRTRKAA